MKRKSFIGRQSEIEKGRKKQQQIIEKTMPENIVRGREKNRQTKKKKELKRGRQTDR